VKPAAVKATAAKAILLILLSQLNRRDRRPACAQITAAPKPNQHGYGTAPFADKVYREF